MAAFAWAEALTLIAQTPSTEAVYQEVVKHFTERELVDLSMVIVNMNAWNRMALGFHMHVPVRTT
jgi:alkylhydroperoxidase family enzyme